MYESDNEEHREEEDLEETIHEVLFYYTTEDCVDWMASNLARQFPNIRLEVFEATEWRKGLHVTIPAQSEYSIAEVEDKAFAMRDKLFFVKDILIALRISRAKDD